MILKISHSQLAKRESNNEKWLGEIIIAITAIVTTGTAITMMIIIPKTIITTKIIITITHITIILKMTITK